MNTSAPPLWSRNVWWVPAAGTAIALPLAAATLRPSEQSLLLGLAILCALPLSLALLFLDLSAGFADRAALIVCIGLVANVTALWWATILLRARAMRRISQSKPFGLQPVSKTPC